MDPTSDRLVLPLILPEVEWGFRNWIMGDMKSY
jgi:hypothetical protein